MKKIKRSILEYDKLLEKDQIMICYKGPFMERVLVLLGEKINILLNDNPRLNKKIFSIFMELAQNIAYYSEERHKQSSSESDKTYGKGTFMIVEQHEYYTIISANLIKKSWEQEILDKSEMINNLDEDGLRKLKRELRNQPKYEGQMGGNIGLVEIALKAGSSLDVEIASVDDQYSFFSLSIDLPKNLNGSTNK
jgi:hypothetical protein